MLPKLLAAIVVLAAVALVVLDARHRRIVAAHDVARLYQHLHDARHDAAHLRSRIERAAAPHAIAAAVREADLALVEPEPVGPPAVAQLDTPDPRVPRDTAQP